MICRIEREPPVEPKIKSVTITLTPKEAHDLKVLVSVPTSQISSALRHAKGTKPTEHGGQTNDIYGLLASLQAILPDI